MLNVLILRLIRGLVYMAQGELSFGTKTGSLEPFVRSFVRFNTKLKI